MRSLFDDRARQEILGRLDQLTETQIPRWGKLTAATLLPHLIDSLEVALGERSVEVKRCVFNSPLGRWFVIDAPIPWPKGTSSVPEYFVSQPEIFARDHERARSLVERFGKGRAQPFGQSPMLGKLTPDQWARLNYRHLDHHLRQFGR
jgi:hypothetical protein